MRRIVLIIALASLCGGCATVIRGTTDEVAFKSSPSGAEVHTSNGLGCVTPCTLQIKKTEEFVATFKKAGFISKQVPVARQIVTAGVVATAGNAIAGGLVGVGVDAVTGAGYDHTPNPVSVILRPAGPRSDSPGPTSPPQNSTSKKPATSLLSPAEAQPPKT
jgi:uncharacterized protein YceK